MSSEIYKKSLITLSSISLEKIELSSNNKILSKQESIKDCDIFPHLVFWFIILNEYKK